MYANTHKAMSKVYSLLMFTLGVLAIALLSLAECKANNTDLESLFAYRGDSLERDVRAFVTQNILPFLGSEFATGEQPDYVVMAKVHKGVATGYYKGANFHAVLIFEEENKGVVVRCDSLGSVLAYNEYRSTSLQDVAKRFVEPFSFFPRTYDLFNTTSMIVVATDRSRIMKFGDWPFAVGYSYDIASWKLREQMFIDIAMNLSLNEQKVASKQHSSTDFSNHSAYGIQRFDSIFISGSEVDALVGAIDHEEITVDTAVDGRFVLLRLDVPNSLDNESSSQRFFLVCLSGRYGKKSFAVEVARDSDENRSYRLRTQHTFLSWDFEESLEWICDKKNAGFVESIGISFSYQSNVISKPFWYSSVSQTGVKFQYTDVTAANTVRFLVSQLQLYEVFDAEEI